MHYGVLVALVLGCASEKCSIDLKESFRGFAKDAPPLLVVAIEKHLNKKLKQEDWIVMDIIHEDEGTSVIVYVGIKFGRYTSLGQAVAIKFTGPKLNKAKTMDGLQALKLLIHCSGMDYQTANGPMS
ncbi:unnamed protein product [Cylicocyclus nassatus]|uniref:Uncharacterized protein n=1 Tax=Cylicocyclus nassatus TaxID=53992 RepID=A0AA36GTG7_CYLNA|nr:unnamed protein product [Cylicocyclus nassatus]